MGLCRLQEKHAQDYKQLQKRPAEAGGFQFAALKNDKTRILRPAPFVIDMLRAVLAPSRRKGVYRPVIFGRTG